MTLHFNVWQPDTCGCEIEYSWVEEDDRDTRTHTLSKFIKTCPEHTGRTPDVSLYNDIVAENQIKNFVHGQFMDNPRFGETVEIERQDRRLFRKGISYVWSFDSSRVLTAGLIGISVSLSEKGTIQASSNTRFGIGKVVIV